MDQGGVTRGKAVFARACSACHTLTGHDMPISGGDLAIAKLDVRTLASFIRVMPVWLTAAEVDEVASYVYAVATARRGP